jgi:hypothetical protein
VQNNPKKSVKLSLRTVLIVALLLGIIAVRIAGTGGSAPATPDISKRREAEAERLQRSKAMLLRVITAAEQVAKGDADDEALVARFKENAVVGTIYAPERFGAKYLRTEKKHKLPPYPVLFMYVSAQEAAALRLLPHGFMQFDRRNRILYYPERGAISDLALGLVVLHELVHWEQLMRDGRDPRTVSRDEAPVREVDAHLREFNALMRATKGQMRRAFDALLADRSLYCWRDGTFLTTRAALKRFDDAHPTPALSDTERDVRTSSLHVALALHLSPIERRPDVYLRISEAFRRNTQYCD